MKALKLMVFLVLYSPMTAGNEISWLQETLEVDELLKHPMLSGLNSCIAMILLYRSCKHISMAAAHNVLCSPAQFQIQPFYAFR